MSSRHALSVYDAVAARKHVQLTPGLQAGVGIPPPQYTASEIASMLANSPYHQQNLRQAELEKEKERKRQEERRRRDPTFRDDALDFREKPRAFDKYVDYYERLALDEHSSAAEVRKAYLGLSQQCHPDKLAGRSEPEQRAGIEQFQRLSEAYEVLGHLPTRSAYDRARDVASARDAVGRTDIERIVKPAPTCVTEIPSESFRVRLLPSDSSAEVDRQACAGVASLAPSASFHRCVDVEVSLMQLFRGCHKKAIFEQRAWDPHKKAYEVAERHFTLRCGS